MDAKLLVTILIFVECLVLTDGFDCYQMSKTMTMNNQKATCSGTVTQCYKYVCMGNPTNPFYILKGCLDFSNPVLSCTTMDNECRGGGGSGTCYTCSNSGCNGASGVQMSMALISIPVGYYLLKYFVKF